MPTKPISIRLDENLLAYLTERAEREHRTLSNIITSILLDEMERTEHKEVISVTVNEWAKDFRSFVNELQMPRDDYKGIMEYIDDAIAIWKQ